MSHNAHHPNPRGTYIYRALLRLCPAPLNLILKDCPVKILEEELLVAAIVKTPSVNAGAEWKTPAYLFNSHINARWHRLLALG